MTEDLMREATTLTLQALDRLEQRIVQHAQRATRTALLQLAPRELVLPSPAYGLLAFTADRSLTLRAGSSLRSLEPLMPEGEARFSVIAESTIHPWRVAESSWIRNSPADTGTTVPDRLRTKGCRIKLRREPEHRATPGWLSIHIDGGELVLWSVQQASVYGADTPLESRSWSAEHTKIAGSTTVPAALAAKSSQLIEVFLPEPLCEEEEVLLVLKFPAPIALTSPESSCCVHVNVHAISNSLPCRYPARRAVEQAVTGNVHQSIHCLMAEDLGSDWKFWKLNEVSGSGGLALEPEAPLKRSRHGDSVDSYRLALCPTRNPHQAEDPFANAALAPAVILNQSVAERLRQLQQSLMVEYEATQGSLANGLPAGTEMQLQPHELPALFSRVGGHLIGPTWGGFDGYCGTKTGRDVEDLVPFVRDERQLTVADIRHLVDNRLGHLLELVDSRDLIRTDAGPLLIRYRILISDTGPAECVAIRSSLQGLLTKYLSPLAPQGFELFDLTKEASRHGRTH